MSHVGEGSLTACVLAGHAVGHAAVLLLCAARVGAERACYGACEHTHRFVAGGFGF